MAGRFIGPVLPTSNATDEETEDGSISRGNYGPALPPHLKAKEDLEHNVEYSHDTDVIGPALPGSSTSTNAVQKALEERAQELKYKFLLGKFDDSMEAPKRESWMTELPPEKAEHLGLGPRKFKKNYSENSKQSRSAWTETPADREKKDAGAAEDATDADLFEAASIQRRNEMMDEVVKKSKKHKKSKKSGLSLLELHQKKIKEGKKEEKKQEGRETRENTFRSRNRPTSKQIR